MNGKISPFLGERLISLSRLCRGARQCRQGWNADSADQGGVWGTGAGLYVCSQNVALLWPEGLCYTVLASLKRKFLERACGNAVRVQLFLYR